MTYFDIQSAKEAFKKLYCLSFEDFNISFKVYKIANMIDESFVFLGNEIEKLKTKYGNPEIGKDSKKKMESLEAAIKKILLIEAETFKDFSEKDKLKISLEEIQKAYIDGQNENRLSAKDIVALKPFIEIIEK